MEETKNNLKFPEIVCPADRLSFERRGNEMVCPNGHKFTEDNGIPCLLFSGGRYTDAFGEQWNKYRITQLDSYTNTTISQERLKKSLGYELWEHLSNGSNTADILEAGCGAGRFTEVLLKLFGARVTSTDLSSAVNANLANCPNTARHRVIRCDINALPFNPKSYDVVLCLGVIQHTPNPEKTIADLYGQVKSGGWLVFDHYTPSISHYTKFTSLLLRPLLKRLPPQEGAAVTEVLTNMFFPLHRLVKRRKFLQAVLSRISPLITYYGSYPQLDDRLQYEWSLVDTHDHLTDYYKHLRTRSQIMRTLVRLGAGDIRVSKSGNGIEACCRRQER